MWIFRFSAILLLAALGCAAQPEPEPELSDQSVRHPVVRINGEDYYSDDLQRFLRIGQEDSDIEPTPEIIHEFIVHRLLLQQAGESGIQIDPQEVELRARRWFGSDPGADSLEHVGDLLKVEKFLQSNISAQNSVKLHGMQQYYEKHADQFVQQDRIRVLEILVPERERAEQLRASLKPGDFRTFRELARLHSTGSTAPSGGELGTFEPGDLPQRFEQVIFSLRVGEISEVFRSELGYHLFTVEERTHRHAQKFYEVYNEIFERLVADQERQALDTLVAGLIERASIEILDPALSGRGSEENVQIQR